MSHTPAGRPVALERRVDRVGDPDHEIGDADAGRQDPAQRPPKQQQHGGGEGHRRPTGSARGGAVGMGDAAQLEEAEAAGGDGDGVGEAQHGSAEEGQGEDPEQDAVRALGGRDRRWRPGVHGIGAGSIQRCHRGTVAPRSTARRRRLGHRVRPAAQQARTARSSSPTSWIRARPVATETLARLMPSISAASACRRPSTSR